MTGVVVIDKPQNMTSHDVVAIMRKKLKTKKIGHTGTLDPMATGVLPICIGKATKIVDFLVDRKKTYHCEMILGSATDTQDCWGTVIDQVESFEVNEETIIETMYTFLGEIDQVPPMYSAIKIGGEKLVDLARQGIVIDREPRKRVIYALENIVVRQQTIEFDVTCSKGTYIRTLCHDIGLKLGCFGHMISLRRTMTEPFDLEMAVSLDDIDLESINNYLMSIDEALSWMPTVFLKGNSKMITLLNNGVKLDLAKHYKDKLSELIYKVYIDEVFWGIAEKQDNGLFFRKILKDSDQLLQGE
ncbi:tRNA pseudouridine(55) synthase TruB [Fusibacter bizertensis]